MADYLRKANRRLETRTVKYKLLRSFALAILLSLLVSFDFVLYMHSGSVFLAEGGINIPVLTNIAYIFAVCSLLMFITFLFPVIQFGVFSIVCALLAIGFMTQFLQIDRSEYLVFLLSSVWDSSTYLEGISHWVVAGLTFIITYYLLTVLSVKSLARISIFLCLVIVLFFGVDFMSGKAPEQISEVYQSTESNFAPQKKKTVFLFLPHAAPYGAISAESRNKIDKRELLQQVELGFLVKNGFKVYSNAYITGDSDEINMVELLNILDNKIYREHLLSNISLDSLWKFKSAQRPYMYLKDNQLHDIFQRAQYKVSTIQNQQIELCKKNAQYVSDRCYSRISLPMDVTTRGFSNEDRTAVLLYQWLNSFELITNTYIVDILQEILGSTGMKHLAYPYERLYVVDSFQVLQKLLDLIVADDGAGVYFVYLNFPDDLLVYDQWCKLKPYARWNTLNPKFNTSMMYVNSTDYNEQMLCLWGQLSDFMQNLVSLGQEDNLTLVLHGVSGLERIQDTPKSFIDKFKNQNLVFMAIRDPEAKFGINRRVCHSRDLLRQHLFGQLCQEFEALKFSKSSKDALVSELKDNGIKKYMLPRALEKYDAWLQEWQTKRQPPFLKASFPVKQKMLEDQKVLQTDTATQILSEGLNPRGHEPVNEDILQNNTEIDEVILSEQENEIVPLVHSEMKNVQIESSEVKETVKTNKESVSVQETTADISVKDEPKSEKKTVEVKKTVKTDKPAAASAKKEVKPSKKVSVPVKKTIQTVEGSKTKIIVKPSTKSSSAVKVTVSPAYEYADVEEAAPNLNKSLLESTTSSNSSNGTAVMHAEQHSVSGDFLIENQGDSWEFDPAKALHVSGDEADKRVIIIKEQ